MTRRSERAVLALSPRGLSRVVAAAYVGVSPTEFDRMVATGEMPRPIRRGRRVLWDLRAVDRAFDRLASGEATAPALDDEDLWANA